MVKFVDLGVLYFSLVLPWQPTWVAGGPEWILRPLGGLKLEGETENMCVWTKKRGSMNAVVLMATPCPKSLHGKGEKWIARNMLQGLDSRQPMTAMTEKKSPG